MGGMGVNQVRRTAGLAGESRRNTATVQAVIRADQLHQVRDETSERDVGAGKTLAVQLSPGKHGSITPSRSGPEVTKGWGGGEEVAAGPNP